MEKSQTKSEKAVPETCKDEHLESEDSEAIDLTNTEAEEDYQDDEDDDGQKLPYQLEQ